jgi:hypothetical protein
VGFRAIDLLPSSERSAAGRIRTPQFRPRHLLSLLNR